MFGLTFKKQNGIISNPLGSTSAVSNVI
jgi:hypothetical protein